MANSTAHHPSSYRDPSGFIFEKENILYRQVNLVFKENFDQFIRSGCYNNLVQKDLLIPHEELKDNISGSAEHYLTLKPDRIPFISYPYEWSFDMLKDAALLTLQVLREALEYGMVLKDATPYNIQWRKGKPVFIDTLSFEKYEETPWIAYRQFCECFLGPLLLMHYSKNHLPGLLLGWPDGMPLPVIKRLLPRRSRFSLHTYLHIHLHAGLGKKENAAGSAPRHLPKNKLLNIVSSLEMQIRRLKTPEGKTTWSAYYEEADQRDDYSGKKMAIINSWLESINDIETAADLGANEGRFSQLLAGRNIEVIASDADAHCINQLYKKIKEEKTSRILPLVIDLSWPSPAMGVNNEERNSFLSRTHTDLVMALALIHHLCIGKNIALDMAADMFSRMGKKLIIEFVPKSDSKIQLMLSRKKDIYTDYSEAGFEKAFAAFFTIRDKKVIPGQERILYLMQKK